MKTIYKFILFQTIYGVFWYLIVSIIGGSIYYKEWNNIAVFFSFAIETGYFAQFFYTLNKHVR